MKCPVRDPFRGNGKIERSITTLKEKLRADKTIVIERGNAVLARLLFALRSAAGVNKISPFEQVFSRKPNTIKEIITEKQKNFLENDETLQLSPNDFPKDDDTTILLRNKTKYQTGTAIQETTRKHRGRI